LISTSFIAALSDVGIALSAPETAVSSLAVQVALPSDPTRTECLAPMSVLAFSTAGSVGGPPGGGDGCGEGPPGASSRNANEDRPRSAGAAPFTATPVNVRIQFNLSSDKMSVTIDLLAKRDNQDFARQLGKDLFDQEMNRICRARV
jgi:hypothetical protein